MENVYEMFLETMELIPRGLLHVAPHSQQLGDFLQVLKTEIG